VQLIDGSTFIFKRAGNLFMVAVTRNNANAAMIFHFMTACVDIFKGYFNGKFDEETLRNNFSLVYELLDGESTRCCGGIASRCQVASLCIRV
jgi:AP-2 complex subunit mu-1